MSPGKTPLAAVLQLMDPPKKQLSCCCTCYSIEGCMDNFVLWPTTFVNRQISVISLLSCLFSKLQWSVSLFCLSLWGRCSIPFTSAVFLCTFSSSTRSPLSLIQQSWDELCWVCPAEPSDSCDKVTLCKLWVTQPWLIQFGDQEKSLTHNILHINYSIISKRFLICLF